MIAESSLLSRCNEGKHRAQGEKVTALVPRVENGGEKLWSADEYAETCSILSVSSQKACGARGCESLIFLESIDFTPGVGYASETFAAHPQND